jgi:UDP-N-acetylglucosamine 2-epimerase (non-hydrolysing)
MKMLHIVGARPNFMKAAPVLEELRSMSGIEQRLVHTGQHYDADMSRIFFEQLGMPQPDFNLGVGSGSHAQQTAEIMTRFEKLLLAEKPHLLVVYGDVNSTIATALVACKLGIEVAHVEAGLRSGDRSMPEEINRILTDAIADILFVSEESGELNLMKEGINKDRIFFVGNSMIDTLLKHRAVAERGTILDRLGLQSVCKVSVHGDGRSRNPGKGFYLLTLHRPSNVDDRSKFVCILDAIAEIAKGNPVVFPCHPRTRQRIMEFGLDEQIVLLGDRESVSHRKGKVFATAPLGYLDFVNLMSNATLVLTDSGGVQEETTILGTPCLTLRNNTERPVTISHGTNILAGTSKQSILEAHEKTLSASRAITTPPLWDGKAGQRIAEVLTRRYGSPK